MTMDEKKTQGQKSGVSDIRTVKASIEEMFSEVIEDPVRQEVVSFAGVDVINRVYTTRRVYVDGFADLVKRKLDEYMRQWIEAKKTNAEARRYDEAGRTELFKKEQIAWAKRFLARFADTDREGYYFELTRWIYTIEQSVMAPSAVTANGLEFGFTNNFNHLPEKVIYDYFKRELVDKKYINENGLREYLNFAFDQLEPPVKKFTWSVKPPIGKATNIFYRFFNDVCSRPYSEKDKYTALLGDFFEGFKTAKVAGNFR